MRYRNLSLLLLCFCAPVWAESFRVFSETTLSDDSDDQSQSNTAIGYRSAQPQLGSDAFWAASIGHRRLSSSDGSESFDYFRLKGRSMFAGNAGISAGLDLTHGDDWSPVLGTVAIDWLPSGKWRFEASAERDIVDTVIAIRDETHLDTGAMSADMAITSTITAVTAVSYSTFSDGNDRLARTARLVWSPARWQAVSLQLRGRRADSDALGVGYFNPRRLEEYEAQIRLAGSPFGDQWLLSLQLGGGQQWLNGNKPSGIYSLDSRVRGWVTANYGLEGRAFCGNVGTLSAASATGGYRSCQMEIALIASF